MVFLERATGIEPASQAWEARVLPMYYTRVCLDYSTRRGVWQMNWILLRFETKNLICGVIKIDIFSQPNI